MDKILTVATLDDVVRVVNPHLLEGWLVKSVTAQRVSAAAWARGDGPANGNFEVRGGFVFVLEK